MQTKLLIAITCFIFSIVTTAQTGKQPFADLGKKVKVLTLTNGKYEEFFDDDSIQQIGTALVNIKTMEIVKFQLTKEEQRIIDNSANARFLSVDPLANSFPWYTPYQFAGNMPIAAIDLDGAEEVVQTTIFDDAGYSRIPTQAQLQPSQWFNSDTKCACETFASAAHYNTNNLNSAVYAPVYQIHKYYVWVASELEKVKANIKFFQAARDVTSMQSVGGAFYAPSFISGLSDHGRKSLADVNSRLLKENMPVIKELLNSGSSSLFNSKIGIIWDFEYVNREQTFLSNVIDKDPLSQADKKAINNNFKRFEFMHLEYTLAKSLTGTDEIDYQSQSQREAIGRSLVFMRHMETKGFEGSNEYNQALNYLRKAYGNNNVENFLKTYNDKKNSANSSPTPVESKPVQGP